MATKIMKIIESSTKLIIEETEQMKNKNMKVQKLDFVKQLNSCLQKASRIISQIVEWKLYLVKLTESVFDKLIK